MHLMTVLEWNHIPMIAILRDLVFVLRGIDGQLIRKNEKTGKFELSPNYTMSVSIRSMITKVGETGVSLQNIQRIMANFKPKDGYIRQSLYWALNEELNRYFAAVAELERRISVFDERAPITLGVIDTTFFDHKFELAFMEFVLNQSLGLQGGPLLTCLFEFTFNGNPTFAAISTRLFNNMLAPFKAFLGEFVAHGKLNDPNQEFFIEEKHWSQDQRPQSHEIWTRRFTINTAKIPAFISSDIAETILLAGKTRAFLNSISDSMEIDQGKQSDISQIDVASDNDLADYIEKENSLVCKQLTNLLLDKYQIIHHLLAIKNFIHFGRGDFASSLMESASVHLSKPAGSLYRHALVNALDQSLISSFGTRGSQDARERMDVRLHETTNPKVTGWDVFTLDYRIETPLDIIINAEAMNEHVKLSHFLWSLRRVHFVMNNCWSRVLNLQKSCHRLKSGDLTHDLRRMQFFIQEGSLLARQITEHSLTIIHKHWDSFFAQVQGDREERDEKGLEFFIQAHNKMLDDLRRDLLLFYNTNLRQRLAAVLSALLKSESTLKGFERYFVLSLEHEQRSASTNAHRPRPSSIGLLPEDETIIEAFPAHQLRLLAEHRAAFQHSSRQFQIDLDEFLLQLKKEAGRSQTGIIAMLCDYSGYHGRRNGFDLKKYCSPIATSSN